MRVDLHFVWNIFMCTVTIIIAKGETSGMCLTTLQTGELCREISTKCVFLLFQSLRFLLSVILYVGVINFIT
jgi:hypothetical protein